MATQVKHRVGKLCTAAPATSKQAQIQLNHLLCNFFLLLLFSPLHSRHTAYFAADSMGWERDRDASFFQQKLHSWHWQRGDSSQMLAFTEPQACCPEHNRQESTFLGYIQPPAPVLNTSCEISAAFLSWRDLPQLWSH